MKITRLVVKHRKDCGAIRLVAKGDWITPWCIGEHVFASAQGSLTHDRSYSWLRFRCNSVLSHCPAILLIREDAVLEAFQP